jgi:hypothetical protein
LTAGAWGREYEGSEGAGDAGSPSYEAPRVERVLTLAELEQEIVYAGQDLSADSG